MEKISRAGALRRGSGDAFAFGVLVSASLLLAPGPAQAQGFFDFLFGGRPSYEEQRPIVAYAPDPGVEFRDPPRRLKRAKPQSLDDLVYTGKPEKKPPPPMGQGPLGAFLNDPTLRAGDVVVTPKGLMVYRGDGGSVHRNNEFVSLAKARSLAGSERKVLASIERANRLAPHIQAIAAVSPPQGEDALKQASNELPRRRRH